MIKKISSGLKPFLNLQNLKVARQLPSQVPRRLCSQQGTPLAGQLKARIKATGPLTVADYMKEVVVNPASGYYSQQESIGPQGDFITSPELSQLFGEMIAVWFLNEWHKVGSPKPMQLVELGPGKGTLMEDILRVFKHFTKLEDVSVHLVELSSRLQDEQARRLCSEVTVNKGGQVTYGTTHTDCPIYWHHALSEVPRDKFTCVLAHEFFDALPIHKLQKTKDGWREILVDIDPAVEDNAIFRYIISRSETPACKLFSPKTDVSDSREHVEVCIDGGVMLQQLATRFEEDGGFLLMADYGHDGTKTDTFRGFKKHQLHDPLIEPGSADLTADVDFSFLRQCVADKALTFGPVTQKDFLTRLGIEQRLQILLENENLPNEAKEKLKSSVEKLTHPSEMGERFKFFSMFPNVLEQHLQRFPVAGFFDAKQ